MTQAAEDQKILRTSAGDFPLDQYHLRLNGREWKILHVSAVFSHEEEAKFLRQLRDKLPYGVTLWASAIALAHEIASRGEAFRDCRALELGAGTGLPGIVAASHDAKVVQTDRMKLAMSVCKRNIELNGIKTIEQRVADWTCWDDTEIYDYIIGSDILYGEDMHAHLRRIFETNLSPNGRILLSDPFRQPGFKLLEAMEADGWTISINKWMVGEEEASPRAVGIFELTPPKL
ncbi:MAG: Methyltransferase6 [Acidobacteria bacterium]|nr:Methyltransferase6 [Acidobacteriota bacterium]